MTDPIDQTSNEGQDSKPPTSSVKMVPESDLIAVKKGLEKQLSDSKAEHETATSVATTQAEEARQQLLREQAAKEQLETQLKSAISQDDMAKVIASKDAAETRSKEMETQLLDLKRDSVAKTYNVNPDILKDKTSEQLDFMVIALKAAGGNKPDVKSFDLGGGKGDSAPTGPLDRAKAIIEAEKEKSRK